jgi:hypothetical protein
MTNFKLPINIQKDQESLYKIDIKKSAPFCEGTNEEIAQAATNATVQFHQIREWKNKSPLFINRN